MSREKLKPQGTQRFTEEQPQRFFPPRTPVSSVVKILMSDAEAAR
jgi:hypothetical protein